MSCGQCQGLEQEFNAKLARRELRQYRRRGPRKTTRLLLASLPKTDVAGKTLLDIGSGVGVALFELIEAGVQHATSVDASSAYQQTARDEAERRGYADRIAFLYGDVVALAPRIAPADLVTLDRVLCCYPDVEALLEASLERAQGVCALAYPRDAWWMGVVGGAINLVLRLRRSPMRFFVHPTVVVDAIVARNGFKRQARHTTPLWQVVVYRRPDAAPRRAAA
jgi:2-polyprenyl-3-methyl-5-hydroxy-6-metoxy-1,4-benzoquinol methylase